MIMNKWIKKLYTHNTDFRDVLFIIYTLLSLATIVMYTSIFFFLNFDLSAQIQGLAFFPFLISLFLFIKGQRIPAKVIGFSTSIFLVVFQTVWIYTNASGFHILLFALLVVLFLTNNISNESEQKLVFWFSVANFLAFFFCQSASPNIAHTPLSRFTQQQFFTISTAVTFLALVIMLYLYAMQLSKKENELFYLARYDALTDIYNRGSFTDIGTLLFEKCKHEDCELSVILLDIDDFKAINDSYGHPVGDIVLRQLASEIKGILRKTDIFARYGGEEFVILLPNTNKTDAFHIAEKIRTWLSKSNISHLDKDITFTISLGVAAFKNDYHSFDDLMVASDNALYQSKNLGKNRTSTY